MKGVDANGLKRMGSAGRKEGNARGEPEREASEKELTHGSRCIEQSVGDLR